eukprot:194578-Chlamydomonas_euryale.AAC.2
MLTNCDSAFPCKSAAACRAQHSGVARTTACPVPANCIPCNHVLLLSFFQTLPGIRLPLGPVSAAACLHVAPMRFPSGAHVVCMWCLYGAHVVSMWCLRGAADTAFQQDHGVCTHIYTAGHPTAPLPFGCPPCACRKKTAIRCSLLRRMQA